MTAIEQIQAKLAKYPDLRSTIDAANRARTITVLPRAPDGFPVSLTERPGHWTVAYEGWHEEFASESDALNCFAFGLSDRCRLKVEYRGNFPHRWTVEGREDSGRWVEDSADGLLFYPFWARPTTVIRQNAVIRGAQSFLD